MHEVPPATLEGPQACTQQVWGLPSRCARARAGDARAGAIVGDMENNTCDGSREKPHRPFVTVCYAQTLDGRLATRTGSSRWISGPETLRLAHEQRATNDAVMVGVGTVLTDDPQLTVRLVAGRSPLRVVVDSTLRTPLQAAVLATQAARGTVLAATQRAPNERVAAARALGATVLVVPEDAGGRVNLPVLLTILWTRGVASLLVEGGASLITALLRAHLADRLVVTVAPKILGAGVEAVGDLSIVDLERAIALRELRVDRYGEDFVLDGRVVYPEAAS